MLVVVGNKERERVENLLPQMSEEIRELYQTTKEGNGQRWLMIDIHVDNRVYQEVLRLIRIRREKE